MNIIHVAFDGAGERLAAAVADGRVLIWDIATQAHVVTLAGHQRPVTAIDFGPDGRVVVTASEDTTARIWDANTGAQLRVLHGHTLPVTAVQFSADGKSIVSAAEDKIARVWSDAGVVLTSLEGHTNSVTDAAFSPDDRLIATASEDGTARVWDVASGKPLWSIAHGGVKVLAVEFHPDGRALVTASPRLIGTWQIPYDDRSPAQLEAFAACRVNYALVRGRIERLPLDRPACTARAGETR